jgi:sulfite exporter TauE/SafE
MCGGISSALTLSLPTGKNFRLRQTIILLCYQIGRIMSYAFAGLLTGSLLSLASFEVNALSWIPRSLAGIFMILMGLYLTGWWRGLLKIEKAGQILWIRIEPYGRKMIPADTPGKALTLGAIWGWLPCGLVYSTLVMAAGQSSPLQSAVVMIFFGLGTVPAVMGVGYLSRQLNALKHSKLFPLISGSAIIIFGIWTLPLPWKLLHPA